MRRELVLGIAIWVFVVLLVAWTFGGGFFLYHVVGTARAENQERQAKDGPRITIDRNDAGSESPGTIEWRHDLSPAADNDESHISLTWNEPAIEILRVSHSSNDYLLRLNSREGMLVGINQDGTIDYGENYNPNGAARIFWEAMGNMWEPCP